VTIFWHLPWAVFDDEGAALDLLMNVTISEPSVLVKSSLPTNDTILAQATGALSFIYRQRTGVPFTVHSVSLQMPVNISSFTLTFESLEPINYVGTLRQVQLPPRLLFVNTEWAAMNSSLLWSVDFRSG